MPEITELPQTTPTLAKVSEIKAQAEENKLKRMLPPKPGDRVQFRELQEWLKLLNSDDADSRITIWMYRTEPIINRQLVDPQALNNIDVFYNNFHLLTEESIINTHGGGSFKFVVKDEDKPKTQMGGFFEARLTIPMVEHPPKLDLREVDWDNPKNKGFKTWARTKKLINENNMPVIEKVGETQAGNQDAMVQAMKLAMDFASKMDEKQQGQLKRQLGAEDSLGKSIGEILLEKMKQDDPNKQLTTLITLISAMQKMQPEVKQQENGISSIMPFLTMMQESSNKQMALMMEMFKLQAARNEGKNDTDDLDKLEKLMNIAAKIKGGHVNTSEKSLGESLIEAGAAILPSVFSVVDKMLTINAINKGVKLPEAVVTQAPVEEPMLSQTPGLPSPGEAAQLIRAYGGTIFKKLGQEGWEFGAWVEEGFGDAAAATIVKFGVDGLLEAAKTVPEFWNQVVGTYGEEYFKSWLTSLVQYKAIMKKMDEGEDTGVVE